MEINNIEDITIENMLENIFTNTTIKKRRKEIVDFYRPHILTDLFSTSADGITEERLVKHIDKVLSDDKRGQDPRLNYSDGKYYRARRKGRNIVQPDPATIVDTNYIGKAGECSVMAELLFHGYNVNNMMVDEGIDLVASKNNVFYYIQVKTRIVDETNKFHFSIKNDSYDKHIGTQMRYILVARAKIGSENKNVFFVFNNNDINRFKFDGMLGDSDANININIEYDPITNRAYVYKNGNKSNVSYHMNRFEL